MCQDLAAEMAGVLDLGIELAVGERAGPAFAELGVGGRIEDALAPEFEGIDRALADDLAALEDDRVEAHLGEKEPGEEAARTHADDDGALMALRGFHRGAVACVRRPDDLLVLRETLQDVRLVANGGVDRVYQLDGGGLAGVVGALEDGEIDQRVVCDREALEDRLAQGRLSMIERQLQFLDAEHRAFPMGVAQRSPDHGRAYRGGWGGV
jgi:hypothetical protein